MANFYQVFKNGPICKYAESYCEYDGDVEVVCGKCAHGKLFCSKCSEYEPNGVETRHIVRPVPTRFATAAERRITMKIVYDDIAELAEVVIRCEKTVEKGKCMWCPFYERCQVDSLENRHILCAEIEPTEPPKGE